MHRGLPVAVLSAALLAACAAVPMTPGEYRQVARSGGAFSTSESFEVNRPFAQVAETWKKKAPECLSFKLGTTKRPVIGVGSSTRYYALTRQTVRVSAQKAELYFQVKYENTVTPEPEGGSYHLIADAYPVGGNKTRVDIYRRTKVELLAQAIRGWASGNNLGCPDPTQML